MRGRPAAADRPPDRVDLTHERERVAGLDWGGVARIAGTEVAVRAARVREAHRALVTPRVPDRLELGSFQVAARVGAWVRLVTHSSLDAIDLPAELLALLPRFDGRPTVEVTAELAAAGAPAPPDVLQRLVDWGVLVEA